MLYKTTSIKIIGASRGLRAPPTRASAWVRVSQTQISKNIGVGMGLRDPSSKLSEWPGVSGAQHQDHQREKGIRNPTPTFLLDKKR